MSRLDILIYFAIGSILLNIMWYISIWFWIPKNKYSPKDFWFKEIKFDDKIRRSESKKPKRIVHFLRLLFTFLIAIILASVVLLLPFWGKQISFVLMAIIVILTPFLAKYFVYIKKDSCERPLFRMILIAWGLLIGIVSLFILWVTDEPWLQNQIAKITDINIALRITIILGVVYGPIPVGSVVLQKIAEKEDKSDWLIWCVLTMFISSTYALLGFFLSGVMA